MRDSKTPLQRAPKHCLGKRNPGLQQRRPDVSATLGRNPLHRFLEHPPLENAGLRFPRPQGDQPRLRRLANRRLGQLCRPDRHPLQAKADRAPGRRQRHRRRQIARAGPERLQGLRGKGPRRLPETRIAFLSIHPAPVRWAQAERQKRANMLVKEYIASGQNLDFIDLWDQFLGPDGKPRRIFSSRIDCTTTPKATRSGPPRCDLTWADSRNIATRRSAETKGAPPHEKLRKCALEFSRRDQLGDGLGDACLGESLDDHHIRGPQIKPALALAGPLILFKE